ncbi:hypothetical protein AVEN_215415-1 [Araneus ventricosus]|uniref:Tc1-like transposase DDE domain-containing protein n=1 Tax=Araneus ventricosus TaxID=182803 RepID=A0A4Y2RNE5_ARAVE|nr:hypothetical protein AVEN_215415-1 [Araneus ventricosus]
MYVHGTFCGQTKLISTYKVLSILKIAEYEQERIRFKCNHCLFIIKRSLCGAGLRQHLSLALSFSRRLVLRKFSPVTCTVNGTRYESPSRNQLIPALKHRGCVDSTIFMQDGAPLHIATPVKQLLNLHFGNDRITGRHFPTAWPPRSPYLNPCDFWLWGYLKDVVYGGSECELN